VTFVDKASAVQAFKRGGVLLKGMMRDALLAGVLFFFGGGRGQEELRCAKSAFLHNSGFCVFVACVRCTSFQKGRRVAETYDARLALLFFCTAVVCLFVFAFDLS
jgi:hypothetical protein